jgi:hypothetical protein
MTEQRSDYLIVAQRDGEFCKICSSTKSEKELKLSSKTSDETHVEDLYLICTECFVKKQLYELCVSESKKTKICEEFVTELQVNRRKEMRFRLNVFQRLSESEKARVEERDLVNSVSEEIGISQITGRRYLDKMCSSAGVLKRFDDGKETFVEFLLKEKDFLG